jgi:hypothetical protein
VRLMKLTSVTMFVTLLGAATLFGQSAATAARPQKSNIHGTIRLDPATVAFGAEVTFENGKANTIAFTDKEGFYEANLPVGFYTMNVNPMTPGFREYRRPLFRVASATNLTLDATVGPGVPCDLVVPDGSDHTLTPDEAQDACGSLDIFEAPSKDGTPFQLFIDYPNRQRTDRGVIYNSRKLEGFKTPVLVAYNLFTLQADNVVYDVQDRILKAMGNVLVVSPDGGTQRADSMTLKIENGEVTPLL